MHQCHLRGNWDTLQAFGLDFFIGNITLTHKLKVALVSPFHSHELILPIKAIQ